MRPDPGAPDPNDMSPRDAALLAEIRRRARSFGDGERERAHELASRLSGANRACDDKVRFAAPDAAQKAAHDLARRHGTPFDPYMCHYCGRWHLTSHQYRRSA